MRTRSRTESDDPDFRIEAAALERHRLWNLQHRQQIHEEDLPPHHNEFR